jgi:hypothetical protein
MRAAKRLILIVGVTLGTVVFTGRSDSAAVESQRELGDEAFVEMGRVFGKVSVAGHRQNPKSLPVFKNRSFCGATVPDETLLIGTDGGLANAVVVFWFARKNNTASFGYADSG